LKYASQPEIAINSLKTRYFWISRLFKVIVAEIVHFEGVPKFDVPYEEQAWRSEPELDNEPWTTY